MRKKNKNVELEILKLNTLGDIVLILNYLKLEEKAYFERIRGVFNKKTIRYIRPLAKDVPVVLADGFKIIANSVRDILGMF